jgi:undecaprenyl-diphosphatase
MLGWDKHLERWQVAHRADVLNPVFKAITYAGVDGAIWLAIALVLALAWRRPQIFVWTLAGDAVAWLLSTLLQDAIPRSRPHVPTLVARPHSHSFPSGHATTSFACATVLGVLVPRFRIAFFVLAATVAWSRVYVGVHYPLDVLAGALLGAAIGYGLIRGLQRLATGRRRSRRTLPAG